MLANRQLGKSLCRKLNELNLLAKLAADDASMGNCEELKVDLDLAAQRALNLYKCILTIQQYKERTWRYLPLM